MKRTTILLAEDHAIIRVGLRLLLELDDHFELVGEATTGRQAVELALALRPGVVIMDITMPSLNGFEATRQILAALPETRVLVLSAHHGGKYVDRMKAVGVSGYLLKQSAGLILLHALREIAQGRQYFSAALAQPPAAPGDAQEHSPKNSAPVLAGPE
jgi:two-component system, NarL family, nitrate/nitrite response regulator NarL